MKLRIILVFILCIFIGSSTIALARMANERHLFVSPRVLEDYRTNIEGEHREIERINTAIEEKGQELEELIRLREEDEGLAEEIEAKLFNELSIYSMASGYIDIEGPGIDIIIDDGTRELEPWENPNDILVHDLDLLMIINELLEAGAEAISLNGQRILDSSSITCSGYTVRVNDQFFGKPFRIRAIGDGSRMSAALIGPGGYGAFLKDWGLIFKVSIVDSIKISAIRNERGHKYMNLSIPDKNKGGTDN
jgi:uncharacterized protein YlxW (UPF0749 family)